MLQSSDSLLVGLIGLNILITSGLAVTVIYSLRRQGQLLAIKGKEIREGQNNFGARSNSELSALKNVITLLSKKATKEATVSENNSQGVNHIRSNNNRSEAKLTDKESDGSKTPPKIRFRKSYNKAIPKRQQAKNNRGAIAKNLSIAEEELQSVMTVKREHEITDA